MYRRESKIEEAVVRWAEKQGIIVFKIKLDTNAGWPDRLFVLPQGTHVWIEFKQPGEEPRPLQEHRLEQLTRRRVRAYWSDNYDDAVAVLEAALLSEGSDAAHDFPSLRRSIP